MAMSSKKFTKSFKSLERERQALAAALLRLEPLILGSVYDVRRRCGNPYCHCVAKPTHRQTLLIYVEGGRRRCKFVRRQDAPKAHKLCECYRNCKTALKRIRTLHKRQEQLLKVHIRLRGVRFPL